MCRALCLAVEPGAETYAALLAREGSKRAVMLDPNIRPGFIRDEARYRDRLSRMLALSDIVKVSDDDLHWIFSGSETLAELREAFEKLYDRCLQDINEGDESSYIFKHHISRIEQQLSYYDRAYAWQDDKDQAVVDYIASMTDGYFCELTSKLFPGLEFPHRTYINER